MQQFIEFIGNHPYLATIWLVLFFWLVFSYINTFLSPVKDIGTHDATLLMNKQDAQVVDIRPAAEYKKGHILGAKQLTQEQVNKSEFKLLEKHKNKPIIVVCAMGMTARKAAMQLLKAGFPQVTVLKGGMNAWSGAGLPVSK
ncbi:MAG: rhodanese-like domain-containing protein [Aestuariibacter sp.]